MGDSFTFVSNIVSLVAAWLGGGVSLPSWRYKAYVAIRAIPGRRHHFASSLNPIFLGFMFPSRDGRTLDARGGMRRLPEEKNHNVNGSLALWNRHSPCTFVMPFSFRPPVEELPHDRRRGGVLGHPRKEHAELRVEVSRDRN